MYTELHLHTSFSFLDGASQPDELIRRAQDLGYTALAITDHDGLHGALEFAQLADAAGIQPITGAEITLADGSHLTLLAETPTGYGNLCRVLTHIHHGRHPAPVALPGSDPLDHELNPPLGDYAEGIILLTGCRDGQLSRAVASNTMRDATYVLRQYIEWFGRDNVFVELQQNEVFGDTARIRALVALADTCRVRYVATSDVHYHASSRHQLQDVLVAIRNRSTLDGCHRERRPNARFALPTHAEMARRFADWPEAIANTQVIARRCEAFRITRDLKYTFPDYDAGTGESPDEALARICWETFEQRYRPDNQVAKDRIREELRLISRHNLSGFFLIYRDLLELAREVATELRGGPVSGSRRFLPPGRGRGSSVSSIVCYLIGLSPVDPLAHDLYVGRFLNEELPSIPDIDLDFPREIRERLIERVYDVYGADHAALVCAFSTYRLRSAVRDVGKALGLPLPDLDRIARLSEPRSADSLAEELDHLPEYAARRNTPPWSYLIELAKQLAGFPRHVTQHVGGMIVSASPLNEIVPIQPAAMEGRFMCQWDKDSCEDARFIKIDFLALGMLSLVEEALDLIDATGTEVDLSRIDFNDPAVYEMIQAGDTVGVFQVESRAQIQMLRRTLPTSLNDLVVQVAIVRPGPIVGGAVTPYVQRRENPDYVPEYDHPRLEKLLKETLGVILYQEQVVQVAEELAGFSAGQADQLRRAMTRKRSAEAMEAMRAEFVAGCLAQGDVPRETAEDVFDKLTGFAEYGFPKSHAAAFALLAYQSCWLKHYYPAEFLCALLNNQPMGFYAPHVLVNDAKRGGTRVLRPDVNASLVPCTVEGRRTVRVGLAFVKGLGEDAASAIARERKLNGDYRSLADLVRRVPLRAEAVRHLIAAGACDGFGMQRREMIWQLGLFIPSKSLTHGRGKRKAAGRQLSLALPTEQDMTELPRTSAWERMADEYRILGMSTTFHPMALLRSKMPRGMVATRDLSSMRDGSLVRIPGLIVCRQRPGTAKGITFLLLEDEFDLVNVVVHPWLYEKQRHHVRATPLLVVHGRVQHAKNNINIVAESLQPIEDMQLVYPYDGHDPQRGHPLEQPDGEVNPGAIELVQLNEQREDGPRRLSDIRAVSPDSHNYR